MHDPVAFFTWIANHYQYLIALAVIVILIWNSVVIVVGNEIALIERRWFGSKMPQGRVVALGNEVGIQARTLGPGLHFLIPFIYKASKSVFTEIKDNEIGIVESVDGVAIPEGRIFAQAVAVHSSFQNGDVFIQNGGQKGPQIDVLLPGTYRINLNLFNIQIAPAAVIEANKIGLVTALDGIPLPGSL